MSEQNKPTRSRGRRNVIRGAAATGGAIAITAMTYVPVWAYDWSMWPGSRRFNCYWFPGLC